jgi:hypothetical protein
MAGPSDEAAARAALQAMAPRLGEPPHALLGVPADAPPAALRAAFLRLTKQFHPQKFARFSPDVIRLANEVFLTIKRAYDVTTTTTRAAGTGAPPNRVATTPGPAVPPAAAAPRARPVTTPATSAPPPAQPPAARARTVPGTAAPAPVPGTARPSGAIPKVSAGAPPAPAPRPIGPEAVFEAALELLRRTLWGEARQAFQKLAVSMPHDKRFRAHMHYARAREAQDAGKPDEARAELQRAVALDPDLVPAKRALEDLSPEPRGGLFNKFFKR